MSLGSLQQRDEDISHCRPGPFGGVQNGGRGDGKIKIGA
jgi:hypothetical protein